MMLLDDSNIDW